MSLMSLMRWRDEMNWARQGKAGEKSQKPKGEKKKKRQEDKRTTVLITCTLSRALKVFFFFGSSPCIFF